MPNNITKLKSSIKKKLKDPENSPRAAAQQVVASSITRNLSRFTNLDEGYLTGGWTVILKQGQKVPTLLPGGDKSKLPINRSRRISLKNLSLIDKINGKSEVLVGNNIFYGKFVNSGTRTIRAYRFMQTAAATTRAEMRVLGIKVEVTNG